tara:strand:+ start:626 stop:898 length:273 start_codon:yes stop_codon:yes gene_type:complete
MKTFGEVRKRKTTEEIKTEIMSDVNKLLEMDEASSWVQDKIDQARGSDSPELGNRGRLRADLAELPVDAIGNLLRSVLSRSQRMELKRIL